MDHRYDDRPVLRWEPDLGRAPRTGARVEAVVRRGEQVQSGSGPNMHAHSR